MGGTAQRRPRRQDLKLEKKEKKNGADLASMSKGVSQPGGGVRFVPEGTKSGGTA